MREGLLAVKGVTAVHNLHIWALTMNQAVMTAHVAIGEMKQACNNGFVNSQDQSYQCGQYSEGGGCEGRI